MLLDKIKNFFKYIFEQLDQPSEEDIDYQKYIKDEV